MRGRFVVGMAALIAVAGTAHAQGGINFAWTNCITQSNAAVNIQYACDGSRNGNPFRMVASFISPADLNAFIGIQMVVDLESDAGCADCHPSRPPLTDWWRLGVGECRDGNLGFPVSLSGVGTGTTGMCRNPWLGANTGGGFQWTYDSFDPPRVRLLTAFARDTPTTLTSGQQYIAGVISLDTFGDVVGEGIAVCAGCCERRALVLRQVELYQVAGQSPPQQDIYYLTTVGTRQHVFWQDHPAECATPTRKATWGSIKATYR